MDALESLTETQRQFVLMSSMVCVGVGLLVGAWFAAQWQQLLRSFSQLTLLVLIGVAVWYFGFRKEGTPGASPNSPVAIPVASSPAQVATSAPTPAPTPYIDLPAAEETAGAWWE
jgi:hypothetical protein